MQETLKLFITETLEKASGSLLNKLGVKYFPLAEGVTFDNFFKDNNFSYQFVKEAQNAVEHIWNIGYVNDAAFLESSERDDNAKYDSLSIFACEIKPGVNFSRRLAVNLTRAFNRVSSKSINHDFDMPVIVIMKQDSMLSIATCERTDRQDGVGEKVGKVSILRNINCNDPHHGHLYILKSLAEKKCTTFDELYKHWLSVFNSELLTKKFYSELSDWYAWAVQVARFPNDLKTKEDDDKFNHEACIRLITRLIFIWFLKQKKLIPKEFFDEDYIRENLIENFNPHDHETLYYNPEKSKYYRLVLQNLFFAMLNCPIVAEGKTMPNNRRFMRESFQGKNPDHDINNIMRYKKEFAEGGAEKFVQLANSSVPFLNGGLFDCLDDKPNGLYYDGFSERKESLEQLHLPDYLFFGDEIGKNIDLSEWYGDNKKKKVSSRGLIDILKRYYFTVEENTPLEQEVSLDPELLGKAFENLLAAYNPETKTSARKQTGSFYTPREIVQFMVDESLIAHIKRTCGDEFENEARQLLSYSTEETSLNEEQRKLVMKALYNCRVLDPACGSGAFPMGVLQQMVHMLRQLDPTNEMWREFMIDCAIEQSRKAFTAEEEEERNARLADIEDAFNRNINDPDYARKLYLIEHCIYGVDIQPIAVQISKLRFFISLIVDQKPTNDAIHNFGIRPLPNLESKFVAANTLIPVKYDGTLVENSDVVRKHKDHLRELNHKIFLAKRNVDKQHLKDEIKATRQALAQAIEETGFVGHSEAEQLAGWDMFNQNTSSSYFDADWMFGIKGGIDVVIGNPPYIKEYTSKEAFVGIKGRSPYYMGKMDLWYVFACMGLDFLCDGGTLCFIAQNNWTTSFGAKLMRDKIVTESRILKLLDFNDYMVFEDSASIQTMVMLFQKDQTTDNYNIDFRALKGNATKSDMLSLLVNAQTEKTDYSSPIFNREKFKGEYILFESNDLLNKISMNKIFLMKDEIAQGIVFPQDFLDNKRAKILNNQKHKVGDGVFGLRPDELEEMQLGNELELIRPYYTSQEIHRYYTQQQNQLWMIYTDSSYSDPHSLDRYPKLKRHLDQFQEIITSSNKPYGLHRSRKESFFRGEKIISQRKCVGSPLFSYNEFDCYVTQTYNVIKTERWNLKSLVGILNSKLILYWLNNKGKKQGENFQVDKEPLMEIPLPQPDQIPIAIVCLVEKIINKKIVQPNSNISDEENRLDLLVYHLYNLTYEDVLTIDPKSPISREEYENYKEELL